jgi:hypothetical protein
MIDQSKETRAHHFQTELRDGTWELSFLYVIELRLAYLNSDLEFLPPSTMGQYWQCVNFDKKQTLGHQGKMGELFYENNKTLVKLLMDPSLHRP